MRQVIQLAKQPQRVYFQVIVTPQLFSSILQAISCLLSTFGCFFCFLFLTSTLHLAPSSGFWNLSLCADRRRANQRTCGATWYVTGDHSQLVFSVPTIQHTHAHLLTIFSTRKVSVVKTRSSVNEGQCCDCPLGPFVMTTEEEIKQAILDYKSGRNGFERAINWRSKIRDTFWRTHIPLCIWGKAFGLLLMLLLLPNSRFDKVLSCTYLIKSSCCSNIDM